MTHVGQEFALRQVGQFGFFLGLLKVGHIQTVFHHPDNLSLLVGHWMEEHLHGHTGETAAGVIFPGYFNNSSSRLKDFRDPAPRANAVASLKHFITLFTN